MCPCPFSFGWFELPGVKALRPDPSCPPKAVCPSPSLTRPTSESLPCFCRSDHRAPARAIQKCVSLLRVAAGRPCHDLTGRPYASPLHREALRLARGAVRDFRVAPASVGVLVLASKGAVLACKGREGCSTTPFRDCLAGRDMPTVLHCKRQSPHAPLSGRPEIESGLPMGF